MPDSDPKPTSLTQERKDKIALALAQLVMDMLTSMLGKKVYLSKRPAMNPEAPTDNTCWVLFVGDRALRSYETIRDAQIGISTLREFLRVLGDDSLGY